MYRPPQSVFAASSSSGARALKSAAHLFVFLFVLGLALTAVGRALADSRLANGRSATSQVTPNTNSPYAGHWSGTWQSNSNSGTGTIDIQIDNSGNITGTKTVAGASSSPNNIFIGSINSNGAVSFDYTINGNSFNDSGVWGFIGSNLDGRVFTYNSSGTQIDDENYYMSAVASAPTISSLNPTSGPVGTTVTITGTNFTGVSAVTFNGTQATYTANSSTQITATVPTGATSGNVQVTTSGGTATSPGTFTVTATGASISGNVFNDVNGNGTQDWATPGCPVGTVFIDTNGNGTYDSGEPSAVTDSSGNYTISGVAAGTYNLDVVIQNGYHEFVSRRALPRVCGRLIQRTGGKRLHLRRDSFSYDLESSTTTPTRTGSTTRARVC